MMVDEIPQEILHDYQNRTVVSVADMQWDNAEHTSLTANVVFEELASMGPIPFTTAGDADTDHGQEVWQKATAGDYGPIADFVPPTQDELRALLPPLTSRQIRIELSRAGLLSGVSAAIATLPEGQREEAQIEWEYATTFDRNHPLISAMLVAMGLTVEQVDTMWADAAKI